ncbi:MAG: peptide ABC transporter substrate-binding protein [Alphaproteobacteria bacterium]|nr:peptide ABC transporter substrate-binding protein [Alphaproteobacteria bacterium]
MQARLAKLVLLIAGAWAMMCFLPLSQATAETILRRAVSSMPEELDPQKQSQSVQRQILNDIFVGLTEIDQTGQIVPGAAESWQIADGGKTYIFKLRKNGRWQDGMPVHAQDFVLAFERLFNLGNAARQVGLFSAISVTSTQANIIRPAVDALDALTLQINLHQPFPHFLFVLAKPPAFPVPSHLYESLGEDWVLPENLIGNGAYQLASIEKKGHIIHLNRSPYFHKFRPDAAEKVQYLSPSGTMTIGRLMAAGLAEISSQIPPFQRQAVQNLPGFALQSQPTPSLISILINTNLQALKPLSVRKALYFAVDRNAINHTLNADFIPVRGLVPPLEGYDSLLPDPVARETAIAMAQELMQAQGYTSSNPLNLVLTIPDILSEKTLAAQIKRDLSRIYVQLDIISLPFGELVQNMGKGDFELVRRNWVADYPDPYNFLHIYRRQFNPVLFPGDDPNLDTLFTAAENSPENRLPLLRKAEAHLLEQYLVIPLFMRTTQYLVSDRISGWSNTPWAANASHWLTIKQAP